MAWRVELSPSARKDLDRLPSTIKNRVLIYLRDKIAPAVNPIQLGRPMSGSWSGHVRFRVGDYRLICKIESARVTILVVSVGHRSTIYDR